MCAAGRGTSIENEKAPGAVLGGGSTLTPQSCRVTSAKAAAAHRRPSLGVGHGSAASGPTERL